MRLAMVLLAACGRFEFEELVLDAPAVDAPACQATYQPVAGLTSLYRISAMQTTWFDAELDCERDGGHLVVIDDDAENAWLGTLGSVWFGLTDHVVEGDFRWVTGAPLIARWQGLEPNNTVGIEDCADMEDMRWNDNWCLKTLRYVCECDLRALAVPATFCDTDLDQNCGTCGNTCGPTLSCTDHVCQ